MKRTLRPIKSVMYNNRRVDVIYQSLNYIELNGIRNHEGLTKIDWNEVSSPIYREYNIETFDIKKDVILDMREFWKDNGVYRVNKSGYSLEANDYEMLTDGEFIDGFILDLIYRTGEVSECYVHIYKVDGGFNIFLFDTIRETIIVRKQYVLYSDEEAIKLI